METWHLFREPMEGSVVLAKPKAKAKPPAKAGKAENQKRGKKDKGDMADNDKDDKDKPRRNSNSGDSKRLKVAMPTSVTEAERTDDSSAKKM